MPNKDENIRCSLSKKMHEPGLIELAQKHSA